MTTDTLARPAPTATLPRRSGSRALWVWIALSSVGIVAFALGPYLTHSLVALAADDNELASSYAHAPAFVQIAFYTHIAFGGTALLVGPFQFAAAVRRRAPRVHRTLGRVYLVSVAVAGTAALVMAPFNSGGLAGLIGFGTLGILWLVTAVRAYRSIRAGDVAAHQSWMIRNFAITYAAVTLRLWIPLLIVAQLPFLAPDQNAGDAFHGAYAVVPFLAWIPNLVVAEIMVRRRGLPGLRWTR